MLARLAVVAECAIAHHRGMTRVHIPAAPGARVGAMSVRPKEEGAGDPQGRVQGMPGVRCTLSLVCKKRKHTS